MLALQFRYFALPFEMIIIFPKKPTKKVDFIIQLFFRPCINVFTNIKLFLRKFIQEYRQPIFLQLLNFFSRQKKPLKRIKREVKVNFFRTSMKLLLQNVCDDLKRTFTVKRFLVWFDRHVVLEKI